MSAALVLIFVIIMLIVSCLQVVFVKIVFDLTNLDEIRDEMDRRQESVHRARGRIDMLKFNSRDYDKALTEDQRRLMDEVNTYLDAAKEIVNQIDIV